MIDVQTISILLVAGLLTGFSKLSVGGMGLLILPVLMISFSGPEALGLILPIYCLTDLIAITAYRQQINWPLLWRLLPMGLLGVVVGGWVLTEINAEQFTIMLGIIVVAMVVLGIWLDYRPAMFMRHRLVAYITGVASGFISLVANAAGPIMSLFMMEQRMSKQAYVSTRAWAFFMMNLIKIPVLWSLGVMHWESMYTSFYCIPGLLVGALIGAKLLEHIKPVHFKWLIRIIALMAAVKLLVIN